MSTAIALIEPRTVVAITDDLSLDDLADLANSEHQYAIAAVSTALTHAIASGTALNRAKEKVPYGEWTQWMALSFAGSSLTAALYMRIARYKERVLEEGFTTIVDAQHYLAFNMQSREALEAKRVKALEMKKAGLSHRVIAEYFGVDHSRISDWTAPSHIRRRRNAKRTAAHHARMRALQRLSKDRAAREAGGIIGKSYSDLRKLAETIQAAITEEGDREARGRLGSALRKLYAVEDEINGALATSKKKVA